MNETQIVKDIVILKEDVKLIKEDVATTKKDVAEIKDVLETVATTVATIRQEQIANTDWINRLDKTVDQHDEDITTIKGVLKLA